MQLKQKDLHSPMSGAAIRKVRAAIHEHVSAQAAAATLASTVEVLNLSGSVQWAYALLAAAPAAGESLTVDVTKNGVSILTAPLAIDSTYSAGERIPLPVIDGTSFELGDVVNVARTYVAGGGPTPIGPNKVVLGIS